MPIVGGVDCMPHRRCSRNSLTHMRLIRVDSDHFLPKKVRPKGSPLSKMSKGTVAEGVLYGKSKFCAT